MQPRVASRAAGATPTTRYMAILPRVRSPGVKPRASLEDATDTESTREPSPPSSNQGIVRRRPTTSSERGKAFRARRRVYKAELQVRLAGLEREIERLVTQKSLWQSRILHRCDSDTGSLARIVREYYTIFQHGMHDARRDVHDSDLTVMDAGYQANFLRCVMLEDAVTGDLVGPEASLNQWRFFSAALQNLRVNIEKVVVGGARDNPCVELHSRFDFTSGMPTLALVFPGSMDDPYLVQKFANIAMTFTVVTRFMFAKDGRINYEEVNVSIVEGFLDAGISMLDVAALMQHSIISAKCTVHEDQSDVREVQHNQSVGEFSQSTTGDSNEKLRIEYLLSPDEEDRPGAP